ncbi:hypothetical protein [Yersinia alsatica]|uniref:glycine-rich domain-containing protein n=1 Tax=Yersinia alsatica TaxID=2890317 RepID=UPI001F480F5C|nr:hypothetical protein [Yersinia alsatica]
MSKIARYTGNLRAFGSNAQGLERTLFGETAQADDLTSQVTTSFLRGWGVVGPSENPSLEDFNAAMYTMSQFIAYQHQMGIPEWDALQEYYIGSLCVRAGETYSSLAEGNIGSPPPSAKWTPVLTAKNGAINLGLVPHGLSRLTSSGSFTVPAGVTQIWVSGCAAGGGGGSSLSTNSSSFVTGGSGGGAGQPVIRFPITVTPGQIIPVTIGTGGTGATAATNNATAGGNTQLGVAGALLNLAGGSQGTRGSGGTAFPANYGGPAGGAGYPAGDYAQDTSSYSASTASGGQGGQGASGPFGQAGPAGRGASGATSPAGAGFGYGAGGSGGGGAYTSSVIAAGGAGAAGLDGYLAIEW